MAQMIRLDITEQDIAQGKRLDAMSCPIALSLRRALGSANPWSVQVYPGRKSTWVAVSPRRDISIGGRLPLKTARFVEQWDKGRSVQPGQLKLWLG